MSKYLKALDEWVEQELISSEQAERIVAYESSKIESSWIFSGLLILGAIVLGIGIISVIAANWYQIPDWFKLTSDFVILTALAVSGVKLWDTDRRIAFEAVLISFLIMVLASFGLIAQIYHTTGRLYELLSIWAALTIGVTTYSRTLLTPFLWVGALQLCLASFASESPLLMPFFSKDEQTIAITLTLASLFAAVCFHKWSKNSNWTRVLSAWTGFDALVSLVLVEFSGSARSVTLLSMVPALIFGLGSIWILRRSQSIPKTIQTLLSGIVLCLTAPFVLRVLGAHEKWVYAIFTIAVLFLISLILAALKNRRLFEKCLIVLGLRFLILYFQAIGGLATTGAGLIFSGLLVIGMASFWHQHRRSISERLERWMQ